MNPSWFDPRFPAVFYMLKHKKTKLLKIGISNDLDSRKNKLQGFEEVYSIALKDGRVIKRAEQQTLVFVKSVTDQQEIWYGTGFTEVFKPNVLVNRFTVKILMRKNIQESKDLFSH